MIAEELARAFSVVPLLNEHFVNNDPIGDDDHCIKAWKECNQDSDDDENSDDDVCCPGLHCHRQTPCGKRAWCVIMSEEEDEVLTNQDCVSEEENFVDA